jgi:4-amino-4-deoxy-L-arabinose transferase-like glycosyltransferase
MPAMSDAPPERERPALRPALLPAERWAKVALVLLMLFALLRSVAWASSQPGWLAPDEDYHWLYTEYVVTQHAFPRLGKPFYTSELYGSAVAIGQGLHYANGARRSYRGDPHVLVGKLGQLPRKLRNPANPPPRRVLHPPLYYIGSVAVDGALGSRPSITRLTAIRYYSAALGMLAVFVAWLLAAQVLSRTWEQLAVAGLVATQPIIAFSSSTVTIDVATIVTGGAVLAWLAFLLTVRPDRRQGIGLGVVLALALLAKATAIALIPIAGLTLLLIWRRHPECKREVLGIAGWAAGVAALLAGWWYVRTTIVVGSPFGQQGSLLNGPRGPTHPLSDAFDIAGHWFSLVYRSYWFDYNGYEVTERNIWFWLPVLVGIVGIAGLLWWAVEHRLDRSARTLRAQVLILASSIVVLTVPWLYIDLRRGLAGYGFSQHQGRYLTPAYAAAAVLLLVGLRQLARNREQAARIATATVVVLGFAEYWRTWLRWGIERFYGPIHWHFLTAFRHAAFDKPEWVSGGFFVVVVIAAIGCFALAFALVGRGMARTSGQAAP